MPHFHLNWTHMIGGILASIVIFGALHQLAMQADNRWSRAWVALGF